MDIPYDSRIGGLEKTIRNSFAHQEVRDFTSLTLFFLVRACPTIPHLRHGRQRSLFTTTCHNDLAAPFSQVNGRFFANARVVSGDDHSFALDGSVARA